MKQSHFTFCTKLVLDSLLQTFVHLQILWAAANCVCNVENISLTILKCQINLGKVCLDLMHQIKSILVKAFKTERLVTAPPTIQYVHSICRRLHSRNRFEEAFLVNFLSRRFCCGFPEVFRVSCLRTVHELLPVHYSAHCSIRQLLLWYLNTIIKRGWNTTKCGKSH